MTAVVKSRPGGQAAAAQAVELYAQAVQVLRDGKDAQAEELLKKAVAADPSHTGSWQALAQLYDRLKDADKAFDAYRAWAAAGANSPLPYNRIGQIYEARKQYELALEAYTQSLRIEWNQPPTIEAKARMEKILSGQK
jgi:Tfp pilus assembly protein PilF